MELLTTLTAPFGVKLETYYLGSEYLHYKMLLNDKILFEGSDFKPSPLFSMDNIQASFDLLSFLCCQPGDTDKEYFSNYTPDQLNWANSFDCESLKSLVQDCEDTNSEYYEEAIAQFTHTQH